MKSKDFISEVNRRDFLKTTGAVAGAATVAPKKALAKSLIPTSASSSVPSGGWIWTKVGDKIDQRFLTNLVDRILQSYRLIANTRNEDPPDETVVKTKLNQVLRKHIPSMGSLSKSNKKSGQEWSALIKDLNNAIPLQDLPRDIPDEYASAEVWDAYFDKHPNLNQEEVERMSREQSLRDGLRNNLRSLGNVTRDANLGNTENYGYKVHHKIKTGEIKPVDYSKPQTTNVASSDVGTVATNAPRVASSVSSAGAAIKKFGQRTKDYLAKKLAKKATTSTAEKPKALSAPTNDTEFMRDLQNRVTEPEKEKVNTK